MTKFDKVTQAIFPVAGLGTRFLPATKTVPKELLPVLNRPLIDYALEEAAEAGIENIIMVTGRHKEALENYVDHVPELEARLEKEQKYDLLKKVRTPIPNSTENSTEHKIANIGFVRQLEAKGLGHAVWSARHMLDLTKPFMVLSPDDLILHDQGCLAQMQTAYQEIGGNLLAVMDVPKEEVHRYGILDTPNPVEKFPLIKGLVEKPSQEDAPSTLSIIGRYILQPEIMEHLSQQKIGANGEIQLTDAIAEMIGQIPTKGFRFQGTRFDCGSVAGWLAANNAYFHN